MIVVGIDSAARSGFAVVRAAHGGEREALLEHGVVNATDWRQIAALAHRLATTYQLDAVAIEDAYLDRTHGNVDVVKSLSRTIGKWEFAFAVKGVSSRLVMASIWQRAILTGLADNGSKRKDRKRAAALWVRGTFGLTDVSEDVADGIGIATWLAREMSFASKMAG